VIAQEQIEAMVAAGEPGLAVGVYDNGVLVAHAAAGLAVLEHGVPITIDTVFDIASVSKHFTAACLLLLAEDGRVDLDADIRATLPELALEHTVTLRHCLTHTGGLREYYTLCEIAGVPTAGMSEARLMNLIAGQRDVDFPPGSAWSYANTGYVVAAAIVRRITGRSLAEFASERIFRPLGMTRTRFRDDLSAVVPGLATSYSTGDAGWRREDITESVVGDGGLVTTITDLAGWHGFMATGAVLGTAIRDRLLARAVLTDGTRIGYALGIEAVDIDGTPVWWHSGSMAGFRSVAVYVPDRRIGVSVLANRDDRYPAHIGIAIARSILSGRPVDRCLAEVRGIPAPPPDARPSGHWYAPDFDLILTAEGDGDGLVVDGTHVRMGTDGRWHGIGTGEGIEYAFDGDEVQEIDSVSGETMTRYVRVTGGPAPLPVGAYRSTELSAYAHVTAAGIQVGLAAPVELEPVGDAWFGNGLTVRATGDGLTISALGAHLVRFTRLATEPDETALIRGLRE
jgi:CubicO group peptidase (beta-lactamase class C family)